MGKAPVDPKIAAVLSSVFAILGVFGVFGALDLSGDQTAELVGAIGALATTARAWWLHREAKRGGRRASDAAAGALAVLFLAGGCAGYSGPTTLDSVVGRVDIGKAIACARQPTPADKARCLGVEALSVGLGVALDEAAHWGTRAIEAASGGGADDMTDRDRDEIAQKTDAALDRLGAEIAAAKAGG